MLTAKIKPGLVLITLSFCSVWKCQADIIAAAYQA